MIFTDTVTETSLSTLENYMKRGALMAWYYTKNLNSDSDELTQMCKEYGYEIHKISYDPETMRNLVIFKKR